MMKDFFKIWAGLLLIVILFAIAMGFLAICIFLAAKLAGMWGVVALAIIILTGIFAWIIHEEVDE